jgi:3-hydroxybutyryl-CoA dehydratase
MTTRLNRDTPAVVDWSAPFETLTADATFTSRGRTITESDVVQFAALTGDVHPLHTDAIFAAQGPFGARVAHGMLTMSYAVGLVPLDPVRVLALRRITDVVFKRPVHLGDTIHVEGSVAALRPVSDEAGIVSFAWKVKEASGVLLTRATVDVLWATNTPPLPVLHELHPVGSFVPVPL